jgi:hypothetical protein
MNTTDTTSTVKEETRTITVFTTKDGTEFYDKQSALLHELREMREKATKVGVDPMNGLCHLAEFISMFPEAVPVLNELATTFTG